MAKINGVESGQFFAEERKRLNLDEKMFPKTAAEKAYEARKAAEEKGATAAATKLGGAFKQAVGGPLLTAGSMQMPFTPSPAQQAAAAEQRMAQQGMDARAAAESKRMTNLPAATSGADYAEPKSGLTLAGETLGQAGIDRAPRVGRLIQKTGQALSGSIAQATGKAQSAIDASTAAAKEAGAAYTKETSKALKAARKTGQAADLTAARGAFQTALSEADALAKPARRYSTIAKELGSISEGVKGAANLVKPAVKAVPFAAKGLKAAGRLNPFVAAGMEAADVIRFASSPEQRKAMTEDIESKDTFLSAGVEGVLSPAKTILGAGNLAKQALEAREAARVSAEDYGVLQERLAQRKPLLDELKAARRATMSDEEFNKLSSKERVAAMQAARKQVAQQRATAR